MNVIGELLALVQRMRALPTLIGDGEKRVTPGEQAVAEKLRYWPSEETILA